LRSKSSPDVRLPVHVEVALIALFFLALLGLGLSFGDPIFEPVAKSRLTYLTLLGLPVVALLTIWRLGLARARRLAAHFWQVPAALAIYESMKHLHANRITEWLGIVPKDRLMIRVDEALFGRVLPLWLDSWSTPAFTQVMWFFYVWVYYLGPLVALGTAFFLGEERLFLQLRRALVLGLLGGYVSYLLVPVAGPLFYVGEQFTTPIVTQPVVHRLVFDTFRYNWDCFPSLHTAIPWTLAWVAWPRLNRPLKALAVIAASGVTLSAVALRFHYGIDIIAGLAWAALVAFAVRRWTRLEAPLFSVRVPASTVTSLKRPQRRLLVLGCVFVATGCAALLAEQTFEKLLGALLGASTPAAAVVLSIYFLGLTLGAAAYGPCARHVRNPLQIFALLEAGVALWACFLVFWQRSLTTALVPFLSSAAGTPLLLLGARALVACAWILPPTILMGGSFPAMVDALEMLRVPAPKRAMSRFYSLNLTGAVLGSLVGPYLAFPKWGLDGTLVFCVVLDLCAAVAVFFLSRQRKWRFRLRVQSAGVERAAFSRRVLALTGVALASGFVLFSLEVLWTHLMSAVLGNSVYSFAAMLGLVLSGLWFGGTLSSLLFSARQAVPAWTVGAACGLGAITLGLQRVLWQQIPGWFSAVGPSITTFFQAELFRWLVAACLLLPPAAALGYVYPALFRLQEFPERDRARYAGLIGAVNSLGCISGALLTGFLFIPALGSERSLRLFTGICALSAGLFAFVLTASAARRALLGFSAFGLALAALGPKWDRLELTSGQHMYFARNQVWPQSKLLFFDEDTHGGMTTVVENPAGVRGQRRPYRTLLTNGKFQGNDAWEAQAQLGFALIPLVYTHRFDQACIIGLGTGQSAHLPAAVGFKRVDIAEIAPGIVRAAELFKAVNGDVLRRPNVHMRLEDGRNWLLLEPSLRCDLVSMEVTSVWFAGATTLYSHQFYQLVRKRLAPGGVFQQWIQMHHIGIDDVGSVIATAQKSFEFVSFWVFGGQGILVCSSTPLLLSSEGMRRFVGHAASFGLSGDEARDMLGAALSSRLLAPSEVNRLLVNNAFVINTDSNRHLEYSAFRYNVSKLDHARDNLLKLASFARFPRHRLPPDMPPEYASLARAADPRRAFGLP
jgi:spermidine synthase